MDEDGNLQFLTHQNEQGTLEILLEKLIENIQGYKQHNLKHIAEICGWKINEQSLERKSVDGYFRKRVLMWQQMNNK